MSDVATRLVDALSGRYRVIRQIGAGGMATVFLAHDIRHEEIGRPQLLPNIDRMVHWTLGPDGRFLVGKVPNAAANKSVEVVLNRH